MLATSLKQKINKELLRSKFTKSESTKSRIKGLNNITSGFTFKKLGDDFYLYFTCGNMIYRGMPTEKQDEKTHAMFLHLGLNGFGDFIDMSELYRQKAIKLRTSA